MIALFELEVIGHWGSLGSVSCAKYFVTQ